MLASRLLAPTLREVPTEAELISHQLMLRAGLIRKVASGIYDYLPLGLKVLNKVANIIREEMNNAGGQEILMPSVIPAELWQQSGRWNFYGKELLRLKDRKDSEFCIGPTHEEVVTEIARGAITSYKQLPINLYQIQNKFRDEVRPRFGLMRGREFMMKDAYSFHATDECLDNEYQNMHDTYCRIFERCGLEYRVVSAASGNIGGSSSQEFMVTAESGEDTLLYCDSCNYAANIETAQFKWEQKKSNDESVAAIEEIATPNQKSIEEVSQFLNRPAKDLIKTLIYNYAKDNKESFVMVLTSGDREANEEKIKAVLAADWLELTEDSYVEKELGLPVGFLGPVNLTKEIKIIADLGIKEISNGITGANKADYHLINVVPERDFSPSVYVDIATAIVGDSCINCGNKLKQAKGIEVGHIFKLGKKYSEAMEALYLDKEGKKQAFTMGCYGIGVGRTAASAIEQHHDDKGIIWPMAIAPFEVVIVIAAMKNEEQVKAAFELYYSLRAQGIDVLLDDRDERMGVKLNDADLIGYPIRVIIGKNISENKVEIKLRKDKESQLLELSKVADFISEQK